MRSGNKSARHEMPGVWSQVSLNGMTDFLLFYQSFSSADSRFRSFVSISFLCSLTHRTVGFACCYSWTLVGHMAAPNLLILADLIAPFIPLGLCGSLSVVAGGLSLLFPSCWRRPLPNTVQEAENRALVPIKDRYPSFRDLTRSGKLASMTAPSPAPSNVYSMPPTNPHDGVARDTRSPVLQSYTVTQDHSFSPNDPYFEGHYEVADPEMGVEEFENGNWQLYGGSSQVFESNQTEHKRQSPRDALMFKSSSQAFTGRHVPADTRQKLTSGDYVGETNL